jgi:hypothetical protein
MPTTHELLSAAQRLILDSAEMDPDAFDALVSEWAGSGDDKAARLAAVHKAIAGRLAAYEAERDAFAALAKRAKADAERIKGNVAALLMQREELGLDPKIPGVARLQNNGGAVPLVIDFDINPKTEDLPEDCRRIMWVADNEAIRAALASGREIPGIRLGERGRSVRFE